MADLLSHWVQPTETDTLSSDNGAGAKDGKEALSHDGRASGRDTRQSRRA